MILKKQILEAQEKWGNGVVQIGNLKSNREACEQYTAEFLKTLYAFEDSSVLFKPTKTAREQFRNTKEGALSYFIAGNDNFSEDDGFALAPWTKVRFENAGFIFEEKRALVMGNYFFTNEHGQEVKVEYTFGYQLTDDGNLKIDVHHSSFPFNPDLA